MIPRSFYFLRHGKTDWNAENRMQGWTDMPLNANGRTQAEKAVWAISLLPIDLIVSSPLVRAHRTAEIVNKNLKKPLITDERLKERSWGIFEGKHASEFDAWRTKAEQDPSLVREENGYPLPDKAEPYADLKTRVVTAMAEHLNGALEKNILFVAHGGVYRVLRRILTGDVDQSPNAHPFLFQKNEAGWKLHIL